MCKQKRQVSVHERNKPEDVVYQVRGSESCCISPPRNLFLIKYRQVQDLEKQLAQAKQQINHLRSKLEGQMDVDPDSSRQPTLQLPEVGSAPQRRQRPP